MFQLSGDFECARALHSVVRRRKGGAYRLPAELDSCLAGNDSATSQRRKPPRYTQPLNLARRAVVMAFSVIAWHAILCCVVSRCHSGLCCISGSGIGPSVVVCTCVRVACCRLFYETFRLLQVFLYGTIE